MKLLVDFLLVSGFVFSVIVIFLTKKSDQKAFSKQIITKIYLLGILYIIGFYFQLHDGESIYYQFFELACVGLVLLIGPLMHFYIESIFTTKSRFIRKDYLHFITHPIFWISLVVLAVIQDVDDVKVPIIDFIFKCNFFYWFETIVFIGYILFSIHRFDKFKSIFLNNFSAIDEKKLDWTKKFLYGILFVMIIDVLGSIGEIFIATEWETGLLTIIGYSFLLIYLAYDGTYKNNVFITQQMLIVENTPIKNIEETPKANTSTNEFLRIEVVFYQVLENHKPYLDPDLKLNNLANLIGTTDKKLSAFLNNHLDTTFYELINQKRVEAVKEKLLIEDLNQYSIMGIATDCGFKSKSSFNRIFKNQTGLSPTQFIASQKEIMV